MHASLIYMPRCWFDGSPYNFKNHVFISVDSHYSIAYEDKNQKLIQIMKYSSSTSYPHENVLVTLLTFSSNQYRN